MVQGLPVMAATVPLGEISPLHSAAAAAAAGAVTASAAHPV
jgi:hypothetical protein